MKKVLLFSLLTLIVTFSLFFMVGCDEEDSVSSVSLKNYDINTPIEISVGAFDFDAYALVVSYASGKTEEVKLTEEMIAHEDLFKFYQEGTHEITVTYAKQTCKFKIVVKPSAFNSLAFPQNTVFVYDGNAHTVEVEGDIPANAVINYPAGNSFVNAGTYDVTAIVSCEGYATVKLSTTVKIERARYDMSAVKFEAKEFVYDGQSHSVQISGTLPKGISAPKYYINDKLTASATEVGEYEVTAKFTTSDINYEPIADMVTTLKITPADYALKDVGIVFKNENGKVIDENKKIYDGKEVTFDLSDYKNISNKISLIFSVYDENGKLISSSNKKTAINNVGVYSVKVEFKLADEKNYNPLEPLVSTFEVMRTDYILDNIIFNSASSVYDGKAHSLKIEGEIPENVTVSYEYYLNEKLLLDNEQKPVQSVTNAGRYTVKAIFTHTDTNRKEIAPVTATMQITQAIIDPADLGLQSSVSYVYDGQPKTMLMGVTLPEGIEVIFNYYLDGKLLKNNDGSNATSVTDAGRYTVNAIFTITSKNFVPPSMMECVLEITEKVIDITGVSVDGDKEYIYDSAKEYSPKINSDTVPAGVVITESLYKIDSDGNRTAATSARDVGRYVSVFTIKTKEEKNHATYGESVIEFKFSILPYTVEIDEEKISIDSDKFTYNEKPQQPELKNLPAHVKYSYKIYELNGKQAIAKPTDPGAYRIEFILSPESANYTLSKNDKLEYTFDILKHKVDLSNLEFNAVTFDYNGRYQLPVLVGLDLDKVNIVDQRVTMTIGDDQMILDNATDAINSGKYKYEFRLTAKKPGYVLEGATEYCVEFTIKACKIEADGLLTAEYNLAWTEGGYTGETIKGALAYALFGDMAEYVNCSVVNVYSVDENQNITVDKMVSGKKYDISCAFICDSILLDGSKVVYNYSVGYVNKSGYKIYVSETGSPLTIHFVID